MSMVLMPCPWCGAESAPALTEHTPEACEEQQQINAKAREEAAAQNAAWRAEMERRKAAGEPLPPKFQLPPARVVTPSTWKTKDES